MNLISTSLPFTNNTLSGKVEKAFNTKLQMQVEDTSLAINGVKDLDS